MKITLLFASALLLAPQMTGQEVGDSIPINFTGEAAAKRFKEWSASLPTSLTYPSQVHFDMEMSMQMSDESLGPLMDMAIELEANMISDSKDELRSWGSMKIQSSENPMNVDLDYELDLNAMSLRLLLDDHGFAKDTLGSELPKAFQMSADRLDTFVQLYYDTILKQSLEIHGEEYMELFRSVDGAGAMMHPSLVPQLMIHAQGMFVTGWGEREGLAHIQMSADVGKMMATMDQAALPFDPEVLEGLVVDLVVDKETGAMLDYVFSVDVPLDVDTNGSKMTGSMTMSMRMASVPVQEDAPHAVLPEEDSVMDLDPYFDQYLPMIEMMLEMQAEQMRQMQGAQEADEDFEF